jgi:hypothetical protein
VVPAQHLSTGTKENDALGLGVYRVHSGKRLHTSSINGKEDGPFFMLTLHSFENPKPPWRRSTSQTHGGG